MKTNEKIDPIQKELFDIKRLLIFQMLQNGASQSDLATALNVHQSSISRMFPNAGELAKRYGKN